MSKRIEIKNYDLDQDYSIGVKLGEGSYGIVYKVTHNQTKEVFAAKIICNNSAIEELNVLQIISSMGFHKNIIKPLCIYMGRSETAIILPMIKESLFTWQCTKTQIPQKIIKYIIFQILQGLNYMHGIGILHRDVKTQNILITDDLQVYIIDFGMSKFVNGPSGRCLEFEVQTHRAPELFLGAQKYGGEVDIWATGCIMTELMTGFHLLGNIVNQWDMIKTCPDLIKLPNYKYCQKYIKNKIPDSALLHILKKTIKKASILKLMLEPNPSNRPTALCLMQNDYFCKYNLSLNEPNLQLQYLTTNQSMSYCPFTQKIMEVMYNSIIKIWMVDNRKLYKNWMSLYTTIDLVNRVLCENKELISLEKLEMICLVSYYLSQTVSSGEIVYMPECDGVVFEKTQREILTICEFFITVPTHGHFLEYFIQQKNIKDQTFINKIHTTSILCSLRYNCPPNDYAKYIMASIIFSKFIR